MTPQVGTPSPLDTLDPEAVPPENLLAWQPAELVAVLGEHRGRHWGMVRCLGIHPRGRRIASGGDEPTIRIWDSVTLQEWAVLSGHSRAVLCLAFAPTAP